MEIILKDYKEILRSFISAANTKEAIDSMVVTVKNENKLDSLLLLSSRKSELGRQEIAGTLTIDEQNVERNKISKAVISLIGDLLEDDLVIDKTTQNKAPAPIVEHFVQEIIIVPSSLEEETDKSIHDRILILCNNEQSMDEMSVFARSLNFTNVTIRVAKAFENADDFNLIIFDAHHIEDPSRARGADADHLDLLDKYLARHYFMVWYGNHYEGLNKYREFCHAANSRFSLYGRIREMLDYLNHFRLI